MSCDQCDREPDGVHRSWRKWTILYALLAVIGVLLWTDHGPHLFAGLPYLLLLSFPILHVLLHRRYRGHAR